MTLQKTLSYDLRAKAFWTLSALILGCLVIYIYGITVTVHNTVFRSELEQNTALLSVHIGEMEFSYIDLKNKVSLEMAYERGFENVLSPVYISRSNVQALSMNTVKR